MKRNAVCAPLAKRWTWMRGIQRHIIESAKAAEALKPAASIIGATACTCPGARTIDTKSSTGKRMK
ncbi:MAG: hypothetical protein EBU09_07770 [Betaproteobacteria bacterium]|nr:hypothetical protein [Betaproteobacteria bacterium]NBU01940.1 hypothetical protein [Betaproteobacteria bacterium]